MNYLIHLLLRKIEFINKYLKNIDKSIYSEMTKERSLIKVKRLFSLINTTSDLTYILNSNTYNNIKINLIDLILRDDK